MKKFAIIALSAAACWGLTSCDEYTLPNPPAQSNPEEVVFKAEDLKLTSTVDGTVDLPKYVAEQQPVKLFDMSLTDFPASSELSLIAECSADDTFGKTEDIPLTLTEENTVTVRAGELQQMFNTIISKDLVPKDVYVRVAAYAVRGNSKVRLGGPDYYYYNGVLNILPEPQANVIETAYYLVGSFCDWDISKGLLMKQLNEGNQYDNPDFMLKVDVTEAQADAGGYIFKIVPVSGFEKNSWEGSLGFADITKTPAGANGNLIATDDKETEAYKIEKEGGYMVKINMETRRFEVNLASDFLWAPSYGTSISNFNSMMRLTTSDYVKYEGSWPIKNGGFWLAAQPSNVRGFVYRPDGDTEVIADDKKSFTGKMVIDPSLNTRMKIGTPGLYYVTADIVTLEYTGKLIEEIDVIGAFNDWDLKKSVPLTADKDFKTWSITGLTMKAGEFKFCVSKDWGLSYGSTDGTSNELRQNGKNFNIAEDGVYNIVLDFSKYPAHMTITKQ